MTRKNTDPAFCFPWEAAQVLLPAYKSLLCKGLGGKARMGSKKGVGASMCVRAHRHVCVEDPPFCFPSLLSQ